MATRTTVVRQKALLAMLRRFDHPQYSSFIALIVLFIISSILGPYFLRPGNLVNILNQVSYTRMIALGQTFGIITGGIDLSVGSLVAFNSTVGLLLLNLTMRGGGSEALASLVGTGAALAIGFASGALNGVLVTRVKLAPFIVTLGTMAIFRSLALFLGNAGEITSTSRIFGNFGLTTILIFPVPVWTMLILAFVMDIVLNQTRYGRYLSAVGSNARVALFSAINVDRVKLIAYTITGLIVGVSSALLASRFNAVSTSSTGLGYELDSIAAVIIGGSPLTGGHGTIWGTTVGAIVLGIINNMLNFLSVSPYLQGTVKGLVIIGAVLIQRQRS